MTDEKTGVRRVTVSVPQDLYEEIKRVTYENGETLSGFFRKSITARLRGN